MDVATRLVALAVIELTVRQIADPGNVAEHRDELAVIMRDVDPQMVAVEVATVMAGVAVGYRVPLGSMLAEMRARVLAGG